MNKSTMILKPGSVVEHKTQTHLDYSRTSVAKPYVKLTDGDRLCILNYCEKGITWDVIANKYNVEECRIRSIFEKKLKADIRDDTTDIGSFYKHLEDNWTSVYELEYQTLIFRLMFGSRKARLLNDIKTSMELIEFVGCNRAYINLILAGEDVTRLKRAYKSNKLRIYLNLGKREVDLIIEEIENIIINKFVKHEMIFQPAPVKISLTKGVAYDAFVASEYCDHEILIKMFIKDQSLTELSTVKSVGAMTIKHIKRSIINAICDGYKKEVMK